MHELAARLARGEEAAFAELYDCCADRLHRYLACRLGSGEAASDMLQTAFMRAVKSRRRLRGVENPVAYLFQIARNEVLRAERRRRRNEPTVQLDNIFAVAGDECVRHEDSELVAKALGRLTSEDREVIELKIFAGLTFREIADITSMPQGTVATLYRRALESLRPWLAKQLR